MSNVYRESHAPLSVRDVLALSERYCQKRLTPRLFADMLDDVVARVLARQHHERMLVRLPEAPPLEELHERLLEPEVDFDDVMTAAFDAAEEYEAAVSLHTDEHGRLV
jgi:hypothetical protein